MGFFPSGKTVKKIDYRRIGVCIGRVNFTIYLVQAQVAALRIHIRLYAYNPIWRHLDERKPYLFIHNNTYV